jgi:hypothetical protein
MSGHANRRSRVVETSKNCQIYSDHADRMAQWQVRVHFFVSIGQRYSNVGDTDALTRARRENEEAIVQDPFTPSETQ